ncbi:MAG: hypothetical protein B6242_07540 [Anaerolineaceae bacterium 4572_78]|nr:MAG: hypothetical protein B6242_07540 [Anaerolineaceae bacterium 4572_78]
MKKILSQLLNIKSGEEKIVFLLILHFMFIGVVRIFNSTACYSLFFSEFNATTLPYLYIGSAFVTTSISVVYLRFTRNLTLFQQLAITLTFLISVMLTLRFILGSFQANWLVLLLPMWVEVIRALTSLEGWELAGNLLDVRQGKRLFGIVGGGIRVAIIFGGMTMAMIVDWSGVINLFLISAFGLFGCLLSLIYIARKYSLVSPSDTSADTSSQTQKEAISYRALFNNRYILMIIVLVIIFNFGYYFTDNIFFNQAEVWYPTDKEFANFYGIFSSLSGMLTLIMISITGPIITRYGIRIGLIVMPITIAIGSIAMITLGTISTTILFWIAVMLYAAVNALDSSIDQSSNQILFQPLLNKQRGLLRALTEGIAGPIALGLTGVILLILNNVLNFSVFGLAGFLLVIAFSWLGLTVFLGHEYKNALVNMLSKRRLGGELLTLDSNSLRFLREGLQSSNPEVMIYSLNMLLEHDKDNTEKYVNKLVSHPSTEVRQVVLRKIEQLEIISALPLVRNIIRSEKSHELQSRALRTLVVLGNESDFDEVCRYLDHHNQAVRLGAMVGLMRSGSIEGILVAGEHLISLINSKIPQERVFAAEILGEIGVKNFYRPLLKLLHDEHPNVQRASVIAAGKLKNPKLWQPLIEYLSVTGIRRFAKHALTVSGVEVVPELIDAFHQKMNDRDALIRIVNIMERVGGENTLSFLSDKIDFRDEETRYNILVALKNLKYQVDEKERPRVETAIETEFSENILILTCLADTADNELVTMLHESLEHEFEQSRDRILMLFSFIYDRDSILKTRNNLSLDQSDKQAYAIEVLDVLLSQKHKSRFLSLVEHASYDQRIKKLQPKPPYTPLEIGSLLQNIITVKNIDLGAWVKACAIYLAVALEIHETYQTVVLATQNPDPLIRDTSIKALSTLKPIEYQPYLSSLSQDFIPFLTKAIEQKRKERQEKNMLSTIEKVMVLKKVDLFRYSPHETLVEVVNILEEVELSAEEVLFNKGDIGDSMYMVIYGKIRIFDKKSTFDYKIAGQSFGEMAILDKRATRSASAAATEDTFLFRLGEEPFSELMADRFEIVEGVIQVLLDHINNVMQKRIQNS